MFGSMVSGGASQAFIQSRGGNVAMMWGLMGAVLVAMVGLTVDFTRAQSIRMQMQNAADGAALVAERSITMTLAERTVAARAYFDAEMGDLAAGVATFNVEDLGDVGHRVEVSMPMQLTIASLIRDEPWMLNVASEAEQGGRDLEVALVLDTTGSMAGSRITDLRAAATDFVNIVVADEQEPYYSKVALVPYSLAVNMGSNASSVRGTLTGGRSISSAAWASSPQRNITGATRANPIVITSNGHGFANGDRVRIRSVGGMTQLNNNTYTVAGATTNTFQLQGINGTSGYSNYSSGGNVTRCARTNCEVVVTANSHGLATNDYVYITGVGGMTQINNTTNSGAGAAWQVTRIDNNTYQLNSTNGPTYSAYTSGGTSYCTAYGCEYIRFLNPSSTQRRFRADNCVTERTGTERYSDASPSSARVGIHYPNGGTGNNACASAQVMPLTDDRSALNSRISTLSATGYTAGQIGIGWGYYMLSPNFGSIWPADNRAAAYDPENVLKIAVIMTDGEFNTHYCNGVVSSNSSSVSSSNRINCNASNGTGFEQAEDMCDAMKAEGIIILTVGFDLGSSPGARDVLEQCASGAGNFFEADNGAELRAAFQQIANAIQQLRLTH